MSEESNGEASIVLPGEWANNKSPVVDQIPTIVPFEQWGKKDQSPLREYIGQVFRDYPEKTVSDISKLFQNYSDTWDQVEQGTADLSVKWNLDSGAITVPSKSDQKFTQRSLGGNELAKFQQATVQIERFRSPENSGEFGEVPESGIGANSRFYLNVADGEQAADMMSKLVNELHRLKDAGKIPYWWIKSEGSDDQGNFRFSPAYIDKGGVIVYTPDESLSTLQEMIVGLHNTYPAAFFAGDVPFKYEHPGTPNHAWTVAMQAGKSINTATPEQGMIAIVRDFMPALGLNKEWVGLKTIGVDKIRQSWERSCQLPYIQRSPQEPWLTTDRPRPAFFV